jgi:TetR/AcrR family transcriptional repressor of multidrug resistance operon
VEKFTEKKRAIFESTLDLVTEKGFHGCPMSSVAKTAGVAAGTIYHHFESKDQLICELYDYLSGKLRDVMFAGENKEMDFKERFFNFWMNLYNFYILNPSYPRFCQQFVHSPYYASYGDNGVTDPFLGKIFHFLQEGVDQEVLQPVNPVILGVLVHNNIMTSARIYGFGRVSLGSQELDQIKEMLWNGISKS